MYDLRGFGIAADVEDVCCSIAMVIMALSKGGDGTQFTVTVNKPDLHKRLTNRHSNFGFDFVLLAFRRRCHERSVHLLSAQTRKNRCFPSSSRARSGLHGQMVFLCCDRSRDVSVLVEIGLKSLKRCRSVSEAARNLNGHNRIKAKENEFQWSLLKYKLRPCTIIQLNPLD